MIKLSQNDFTPKLTVFNITLLIQVLYHNEKIFSRLEIFCDNLPLECIKKVKTRCFVFTQKYAFRLLFLFD
ncbi:hypothetical protein AF62_05285 [Streptococcus uberis C8329]|nr:hypothetical protein AF62_05285 [Streptococcus uberis C8329]